MSGNAKAGIGKENAAVRIVVAAWMVVLFVVLPLVLG